MKNKLIKLYEINSKHSNYQVMPTVLKDLIPSTEINIKSRFEFERLAFLKEHLNLSDKKILDIGGNSGFFTFESITNGAKQVDYIEGNKAHADFVKEASTILNLNVHVYNQYLNFDAELPNEPYDIILLFNVIHHFGDDFGDKGISIQNAKEKMIESINYFIGKTEYLVLQLGFCWKGDRNTLLFKNGTKEEMIDFVSNGVNGNWSIESIGVAEDFAGVTEYKTLNKTNIIRNDSLGEFRNRPIFILKALNN